jgi:hypothetical protein
VARDAHGPDCGRAPRPRLVRPRRAPTGVASLENEAASVVPNGYDDTISIAQKSLVKYAPLIGALSGLIREPVRYWYGM